MREPRPSASLLELLDRGPRAMCRLAARSAPPSRFWIVRVFVGWIALMCSLIFNQTALPVISLGFLLLGIGLLLLWRPISLFVWVIRIGMLIDDRAGKMCPNCLYDLTGVDQMDRCPECGFDLAGIDLESMWREAYRNA